MNYTSAKRGEKAIKSNDFHKKKAYKKNDSTIMRTKYNQVFYKLQIRMSETLEMRRNYCLFKILFLKVQILSKNL